MHICRASSRSDGAPCSPRFSSVASCCIANPGGKCRICFFGNFFQQRARAIASSEIIVFVRSVVAAVVIFLLAYLFGQHASIGNVQASLSLLLINGVLILGLSKML